MNSQNLALLEDTFMIKMAEEHAKNMITMNLDTLRQWKHNKLINNCFVMMLLDDCRTHCKYLHEVHQYRHLPRSAHVAAAKNYLHTDNEDRADIATYYPVRNIA